MDIVSLKSQNLVKREDFEILGRYNENFLEFFSIPIILANNSGEIIFLNKHAERLTGYNTSGLINKHIGAILDQRKKCEKFLLQGIKSIHAIEKEFNIIKKNKETFRASIRVIAQRDISDQIIGFFISIENPRDKAMDCSMETREMAKMKEVLTGMLEDAEEDRKKIQAEEIKTRTALFSLDDGLIVLDKKNRVVLLNPRAENILEIREKDILNKQTNQMDGYPRLVRLFKLIKNNKEKNKYKKIEFMTQHPMTKFYQITVNNAIIKNMVVNKIITLHDISREKEIDRIKSEFISIAAHQLRTPLSAIKWSISIAMENEKVQQDTDLNEILSKGYRSNERVIKLINEMLNVSRIEDGRFNYEYKECQCDEILNEVFKNLENKIKEKNLKIIINKPDNFPKLNIDKGKMTIAMQNLIDNAVNYTPAEGKIEIGVSIEDGLIKIKIKDSGVGIPDSDKEKLFTKFKRGSNVMRMQTEGSGLGLFIAKNIIEGHGGNISLNSKEGVGTEFNISIPIKRNL